MTVQKTIKLKNSIKEIQKINQFLDEFGKQQNLTIQTRQALNLSLEEIFTNIVLHGYNHEEDHKITIQFNYSDGSLFIFIEDEGIPFNPLEVARPNINAALEDRQVGGLGIHLVRSLMDQVTYKREDNKNILTLKKKIR